MAARLMAGLKSIKVGVGAAPEFPITQRRDPRAPGQAGPQRGVPLSGHEPVPLRRRGRPGGVGAGPRVSAIRFQVNGEGRHSGDLDRMIWPLPENIATLSSLFTLTPGDLIHTDTPEGVGAIKATTGPPGSNPQ